MKKTARDKCLSAFQKLRRVQCADENGYVTCISCGKKLHWKESDGGHYISRRYRETELEEDNVWPQCKKCNMYGAGEHADYRRNLIRLIGEDRVQRIEDIHAAKMGDEEAYRRLTNREKLQIAGSIPGALYDVKAQQYRAEIRTLKKEKGL
ncbi:MAG: recombination protein NinG [Spirochaetia bacterium]|nr:recombination protein NinG [Spirochaetia bacterium]